MKKYDVIGDIHGYAEPLETLLKQLGYQEKDGVYSHSDPNRTALFIGDYIDRGPDNFRVIDIVRNMVDAGHARALMGNHDLNAVLYHMRDPENSDKYLRTHEGETGKKNTQQHQTFLDEYEAAPAQGRKNIEWLKSLPAYAEEEGFSAIHAMPHLPSLQVLRDHGILDDDNRINPDKWPELAREGAPVFKAIELLIKGQEYKLPEGIKVIDAQGHKRNKGRVRWWVNLDKPDLTWRDVILDI